MRKIKYTDMIAVTVGEFRQSVFKTAESFLKTKLFTLTQYTPYPSGAGKEEEKRGKFCSGCLTQQT